MAYFVSYYESTIQINLFLGNSCFKDCIDYDGNDIIATESRGAAGCQRNCQNNKECLVWTYDVTSGGNGNNCWLKSSDNFIGHNCDRISGPKYCGMNVTFQKNHNY